MNFVLNLPSLNGNGIGLWCNGNTTVFGAVFQGSSPCRPTKNSSSTEEFFFMPIFLCIVILKMGYLYVKKTHQEMRLMSFLIG